MQSQSGRLGKGEANGFKKGMKKGVLTSILSLMERTGWTVDEALKALRLPDADRPMYLAEINR